MNEGLIPRRYAKALYKVAVERNLDSELYSTMKQLSKSFSENNSLDKAIANPFIDYAQKNALLCLAAGFSQTSDDSAVKSLFADFLKLLDENRRMNLIRDIALAYLEIYRKAKKIYVVDVRSAAELDNSELSRLEKLIMSHLPEGGSIELSTGVDPDLIGGFTVAIDNERLDASVKNELKQLRLKLM